MAVPCRGGVRYRLPELRRRSVLPLRAGDAVRRIGRMDTEDGSCMENCEEEHASGGTVFCFLAKEKEHMF